VDEGGYAIGVAVAGDGSSTVVAPIREALARLDVESVTVGQEPIRLRPVNISDVADASLRVDSGGRRIIKIKTFNILLLTVTPYQ
jgi:hypothetical protein